MMLTVRVSSKSIPVDWLALWYISFCLTCAVKYAASDLKWLTYLEIIVPIRCLLLDLADKLTTSIALWRIVALEVRTVLYRTIIPQDAPQWAY